MTARHTELAWFGIAVVKALARAPNPARVLAAETGLSRCDVDHAIRWLKNRRLIDYGRAWLLPDPASQVYVQGRAWRLTALGEINAQDNAYVTGLTVQPDILDDRKAAGGETCAATR